MEVKEFGIGDLEGVFCGGVYAGLRDDPTHPDLAFIRTKTPALLSAVFTANRFAAAPIKHFQAIGETFESNFILINAKNANAMTGKRGIEDIDTILAALSKKITLTNAVMSSTGVIGYRLPTQKIVTALEKFDFDAKDTLSAAKAIMTTDKYPKQSAVKVTLDNGNSFRIAAIAKGAGMINPQMATMLAFIVTDAAVPKAQMRPHLQTGADYSFNRISVDGDMSTNDTAMLLSTGTSGVYEQEAFEAGLKEVMFDLAIQILRDGEGATKSGAFKVKGAKDDLEAKRVAEALSNSLLVKTALFGEDPNWGRIASTIGAANVECNEESLRIRYDDLIVYDNEHPELDSEHEEKAYKIMQQSHFTITCDLGIGDGSYTTYGCDLGYEYVKINAEYRS